MGLGTKLKDAIAGDHHDTTYEETKPPGAYPEEGTGRHTDGRKVVPPHGSAVPSSGKAGMTGATGPTYDEQRYEPGSSTTGGRHGLGATGATAGAAGLESDPRHNKLHKMDDPRSVEGSREYGRGEGLIDPSREKGGYGPGHTHQDSGVDLGRTHDKKDHPYWGDMDERQRHRHGATEGVAAGAGAAGAGYGASRLAENELPDRTRHGHGHGHETHGLGPGSRNEELQPTGEAVGGGVYNTVTGAGSPEKSGNHIGHHGQPNHPGSESRTTGTSGGIGGPTPGYSDTSYDPKNGTRDSIPTSRDDRTAPGVVGAGAGIGAAGLGASELSRKHHEKDLAEYDTPPNHHARGTHEPGVPHSSMLDPYPSKEHPRTAVNDTTSPRGGMVGNPGHHATEESRFESGPGYMSHSGPESSRFENEPRSGMGPTSEASRFDTAPRSGMGAPTESSGFEKGHGSGMGPAAAAAGAGVGSSAAGSSMGKNHYGPAHEGAKVMHTCHSCGADNDISHYFKKDAVYRIGS